MYISRLPVCNWASMLPYGMNIRYIADLRYISMAGAPELVAAARPACRGQAPASELPPDAHFGETPPSAGALIQQWLATSTEKARGIPDRLILR
jgi:hypothetical protein